MLCAYQDFMERNRLILPEVKNIHVEMSTHALKVTYGIVIVHEYSLIFWLVFFSSCDERSLQYIFV